MKILISAICGLIFGTLICATPVDHVLGAKECTWGPTHWCANFQNAKQCNAMKHCIQTVWEKQIVPVDNDEICKICLDMVRQARDQLESNETQSDLKAVFEGSCNLIPIKMVRKECDKLADDFVPQLVEALSSQMNPNVVCSVAGLCNNAAIDKMLEEMPAQKPMNIESVEIIDNVGESNKFTCGKCNRIGQEIANKFHNSDRDDVLQGFLRACGQLSSFSDACSNIVLIYFNEIYDHMSKNLNADSICHLTGVCSGKYHQHEDSSDADMIEIRPMSDVGFIPVGAKDDDIPCKLCEQLIDHLRDLLIANTTESEFKQVLEGVCKQTKTFKDECLSIVDQYYDVIYNTLVNGLDANGACFMIGICPKGDGTAVVDSAPFMPIVSSRVVLGENEPKLTNVEIAQAQLPIDKLMGAPLSMSLIENGGLCTLCEYFLHFVQEKLSDGATEDEIKNVFNESCLRLPKTMSGPCAEFVEVYGDAIMALIIQGIDPRDMCPRLKFCPSIQDAEIFAPEQIEVTIDSQGGKDKPQCPLCLLACKELRDKIKSDKSKENIKNSLKSLCSHLNSKLKMECDDFVETYSSELVEMLVSDFTEQEICVYLKLCDDNKPNMSTLNIQTIELKPPVATLSGDIETNEIPDNTVNGQVVDTFNVEYEANPECLLCKEIIKEAEKKTINKKSRESIIDALDAACNRLRKYQKVCIKYINSHGDKIADLIIQELAPEAICRELTLCVAEDDELDVDEALMVDYVVDPVDAVSIEQQKQSNNPVTGDSSQCVMCEFIMVKVEQELSDKTNEQEIENVVRSICSHLPNTITKQCDKLIDQYGNFIIKLLSTLPPKQVCTELKLCQPKFDADLDGSAKDIIECAVCHGAVDTLDHILKDKTIDTDIDDYVSQACNTKFMPKKYMKKCVEVVESYGVSIIKQLEDDIEQHNVCINIGMCFPDNFNKFDHLNSEEDIIKPVHIPKEHLLGANECTYGPTHFCSKKEIAEKCNAVEYCAKKKVGLWSD
uniref:Putative saposin-related protein n=1 Tax=Corethrella appendiculata TaxID=1370023 RepID=U5ENL5_9DIPT